MPDTSPQRPLTDQSPLPDFCSLPVLFALFVVGALTVTVMWLAPESSRGWRGFTVGMSFVAWLALRAAPGARSCLDLGCGIGSVLLMVADRLSGARAVGASLP